MDSINYINKILLPYLENEHVQMMRTYVQHGKITTFQHSTNVVMVSYTMAIFFNFKIDLTSLLIGALLHDFYLYDWHEGRIRPEGVHGFSHAKVAKNNAHKYFKLGQKELNIIEAHMFPLTLFKMPKSKEAIIVSIADKYCAIKETLGVGKINNEFAFCTVK